MIKNMKKQLKNEKGLTLVELLAVIVILAIIAAIAIPAIGNIVANSKYNAVKSDAINVINAAQLYYLDNPDSLDVTVNELQGKDATAAEDADVPEGAAVFLENRGSIPGVGKVSKDAPNAITATVEFDGKIVQFTDASIEVINKDSKKGSQIEKGTDKSYLVGSTTEP